MRNANHIMTGEEKMQSFIYTDYNVFIGEKI